MTVDKAQTLAMASLPNQTPKNCAVCNQQFKSANALQRHVRDSSKHATKLQNQKQGLATGQGSSDCHTCNRHFGSAEALERHTRDLHGRETAGSQQAAPDFEVNLDVPVDDSSWSMFPNLHDEVSQQLEANGRSVTFHETDDFEKTIEDYDTFIMGAFTCPNTSCSTKKWTSKKIAISIHLYGGQLYNAAVWHQRCQKCKKIGKLKVDEEVYVQRVVYRLKKWLGVAVVAAYHGQGPQGLPHRKELCEGCKNGHCEDGI
jgi:hypothetical protein